MPTTAVFLDAEQVEAEYGLDLVTAETIRHGFIETTRQMHSALLRSSFSNIIRDAMDFGVCVHSVQPDSSTEMVAITEGCTQFAFTHQHMTNMVLDEYGIENLGPGDTLVCNDAWRGGIHFGDLNFFRVIYDEEGAPAFVVSDAAHVFDIGGPAAGGFNNKATSMYEEGLRIPPTLLLSADVPVRPVMNLLMENTRSPMHMLGDVRALTGTLRAGEDRVKSLVRRYGSTILDGAARYTLGLSERRMRHALMEIPDGDFQSEVSLDDDGIGTDPVTLRVEVRIRGDSAEIDFSGTDPQCLGPVKTGWEEASRSIIGPKVVLDPRHPMNAGAMRPFDVLLPPGSMVLALPPASESNHTEIGSKIARLMVNVMSKAFPARAVADESGTAGAVIVHGLDTRPGLEGAPFGGVLLFGAAWGGTQVSDGVSYCLSPLWNCRTNIVEYTEKSTPVVIWEFGTVIDSAGAGRFRGGFTGTQTFEALSTVYCSPIIDAARFFPKGLDGGFDGAPTVGMLVTKDENGGAASWNGILPADRITPLFGIFDDEGRPDPVNGRFGNGTRFETSKPSSVPLEPGEVMRIQTAAPGGYGDPLERDPALVCRDVANELVSFDQAENVYGVKIDPSSLEIDEEATISLRNGLAAKDRVESVCYFREIPLTQQDWEQLANPPRHPESTRKEA